MLLPTVVGCGQSAQGPRTYFRPDYGQLFDAAMARGARDELVVAPYLKLIEVAVDVGGPGSADAVSAALDELVGRQGSYPARAYRSAEGMNEVVAMLRIAYEKLEEKEDATDLRAVKRGLVARALHELALYAGEEAGARRWAAMRGCVQTATTWGPTTWNSLAALEQASGVDPSAPIEDSYAGIAPFNETLRPWPVFADACRLPLDVTSGRQGVRVFVVDARLDEPGMLVSSVTSASAVDLEIAGRRVLARPLSDGPGVSTRFAAAEVDAGWTRIVLRVAHRHDASDVELNVWNVNGEPVELRAPEPGVAADTTKLASDPEKLALFEPVNESASSAALAAAARMGLGQARRAHQLLEAVPAEERSGSHELLLMRAISDADDLPDAAALEAIGQCVTRASERFRDEAIQAPWELSLMQASLIVRRRGADEGVIEALNTLGVDGRAKADTDEEGWELELSPALLSFIVEASLEAGLADIAERAFDGLSQRTPGSVQLAVLDGLLHRRVGGEAVQAACERYGDRSTTDCFSALIGVGAREDARDELARLRRLRQAPQALLGLELYTHLIDGNKDAALALYERMPPAERSMLQALTYAAAAGDAELVKSRLRRDLETVPDALGALPALVRTLGLAEDPALPLESMGRGLVEADLREPALPGAGTAVLHRFEYYDLDARGFLHWVLYDLRRVSGTADVERGAQAWGPFVEGQGSSRVLRRRIHKRDGRILEPDPARMASQAHSDLSQLEQGDYVELILEGFSLPGETGQLVVDTPDLMPSRTSVRHAEIELRLPAGLSIAQWSHPLLGTPPVEALPGGKKKLVYRLDNQKARRIEEGVPAIERGVRLSFGTQSWKDVARAIGESIRALDDRDPHMAKVAKEAIAAQSGDAAVEGELPNRVKVERVVRHVGRLIKVANPGTLSDISAMYGGGMHETARHMIELGTGSRTWVTYRLLRELGIDADIAIAETEPFSSDPAFPAHAGRFHRPLLVVHLDGKDVWIDADLEGPPLPPGRISPELRGRAAILPSGEIISVAGASVGEGDEVDIRLTVDAAGNAKGTVTLLLRGRTSQALAEAFETVVGSDRTQMLRGVVQGWVPRADVEDVVLSSAEGAWEVALRADISVYGFARPEGTGGQNQRWVLTGVEPVHFAFPRPFAGTLGGVFAGQADRAEALNIESALQFHLRRRLTLPQGARLLRVPDSVDVDARWLKASRSIEAADAVVTEDFRLSLPTGTIAANEYDKFVQDVRSVDDGFLDGIQAQVQATP